MQVNTIIFSVLFRLYSLCDLNLLLDYQLTNLLQCQNNCNVFYCRLEQQRMEQLELERQERERQERERQERERQAAPGEQKVFNLNKQDCFVVGLCDRYCP